MSIAMMMLRAQIVRLIYGAGTFDFEDTRYVTSLLGILAVSLFAQALIPLMVKAFYSLRNTKTPVIIAGFSMALNIVGAFIATQYLGVIGLAVSFSAASIIQLALLFFFLSARVPHIEDPGLFSAITKIIFASLVMGAAIYGTLYGEAALFEELQRDYTVAFFALQTVAATIVGGLVYFGAAAAFGLNEPRKFIDKILRRSAA
jgi:putative peptidoglycan lipid II flippase